MPIFMYDKNGDYIVMTLDQVYMGPHQSRFHITNTDMLQLLYSFFQTRLGRIVYLRQGICLDHIRDRYRLIGRVGRGKLKGPKWFRLLFFMRVR